MLHEPLEVRMQWFASCLLPAFAGGMTLELAVVATSYVVADPLPPPPLPLPLPFPLSPSPPPPPLFPFPFVDLELSHLLAPWGVLGEERDLSSGLAVLLEAAAIG